MFGKMLKAEKLGNALKVVFALDGTAALLEKVASYQGKLLNISVKEFAEKRSLSQNAKLWAVNNEIAAAVGSSPNEIHYQMIVKYAPSTIITLPADQDPSIYFKYFSLYKENAKFKAYKVFIGTSQMNTKQMSDFLNSVILEAQELGIDTDNLEVNYAN